MNYKVLYRKYRPDNFASLIGQKHIVQILKNSIKDNKISHAYLFSGPRGTGKTSTARILAKAVNCLNNKSGLACGECDACQSFNTNPDIIEIDAASNNGVEEIRELINNVKIMPTSLKKKVYIIDEVHMLSQSAFNALLLTLEEPPEHVIFILATTNLESVPITIVSRCQRFEFKRITDDDIIERLKYVCKEEGISCEEDALKEIADASDGGLRDALSILDQLSKNDTTITVNMVSDEIGSISNKKLEELIKYVDQNDIAAINEVFDNLESTNLNYKVFVKKMIYLLTKLGAKLLVEPDNWRLSFDDCKRLVMELNDVLMKINISVSPYLLIKMIFLSSVEASSKSSYEHAKVSKESKKNEEKNENVNIVLPSNDKGLVDVDEKKNVSYQHDKKKAKIDNKFIDIRINNCFVDASKNEKNEMEKMWEQFKEKIEESYYKGLISDTFIAASSKKYVIIGVSIPHQDEELNEDHEILEDMFRKNTSIDKLFVFVSVSKWNEVKNEYVNNLRSGYKYEFISEDKDVLNNELDISEVADIFDIDKIEIE